MCSPREEGLEAAGVAALDGTLPNKGGAGPIPPTWAAVRAYFQHIFADAELALGDEALALLQNTSFAALTGWPTAVRRMHPPTSLQPITLPPPTSTPSSPATATPILDSTAC